MIAEFLNRDVVIAQLRDIREDLELQIKTGQIRDSESSGLLDELKTAEAREESTSSGQPGFDPPTAERRGAEPAPLDDFVFISRDPVISLLQSALDEYSAVVHPDDLDSTEPADGTRRTAAEETIVTAQRLREAPQAKRTEDGRRIFDKFSVTDIRWVRSKLAEGIRLFRRKHAFNSAPADPVEIPSRGRLLLVGDWGSGLPRAQKVAAQMRTVLLEGNALGIVQHVVHLGDVYYSGWGHEVNRRFLPYWPVQLDEADTIGSWALNANHEMYSGGYGYFDVLLADPRFGQQQRSSFFSLINRFWRIIGLDTGWERESGSLSDPQPMWLQEQLHDGSPRKTLILSHHQLFSAYENGSEALEERLLPILEAAPVKAWFWGHEHRCVLYKAYNHVEFARCIGHGGIPVYMWHKEDEPYPPLAAYEYRNFIPSGLESWAMFGFAVLDFDNDIIRVRYIDENGLEHRRETIT